MHSSFTKKRFYDISSTRLLLKLILYNINEENLKFFSMFLRRLSIIIYKRWSHYYDLFKIFFVPSQQKKLFEKNKLNQLWNYIQENFSDEPGCSHSEIEILLDVCAECENFDDIFKKVYALRKITLRVLHIAQLILTSPMSSASQ